MPGARCQSDGFKVAELFEKLWPNLRYLGLGIILTWIHLEEGLVSSLGAATGSGNVMAANGVWLYGGMVVAFALFALFRQRVEHALDRRGLRAAVLALCVLSAACIILASSDAPGIAGSGAARVLFALGVAVCGVIYALVLTQCARLYLPLEPGEVLFFSLMAQLLMFVLYSMFNSFSLYAIWEGGPAYSTLLGVCLLPALALWCMATPGERESASETAGTGGGDAAAGRSVHELRDHLRLPFSERPSLSPSYWLMLLTIFIIAGAMFFTLNALLAVQPSGGNFLDAPLGMLLRFVLVLVLSLACFTVTKGVSIEKIFWVGFACIPAVPALLMLLGAPANVLVPVAVGAMFLMDFFIWIVLILAAQTKGEHALLLFMLGQAAANAGIVLGTVLGSAPGVGAFLAGNRLFGACLLLLVVLLTVLLFNEQRIREILGGIAKDGLNVRGVLDKPAAETALPPTRRAGLWAEACRTVGERALLSEREQEILRQLADNRTPQNIADYLCISLHTVRTHTKNIYAKLDVHSRDELIALVRKEYESMK